MSIAPIPISLRELLARLEFISMIQSGQKPCMNDQSFVHADSWSGALKRFFLNEDRISMLRSIESTIEHGIISLNQYHQQVDLLELIVNALQKSLNGIKSLQETYSDDPNMVSRLSVMIKNIELTSKTRPKTDDHYRSKTEEFPSLRK